MTDPLKRISVVIGPYEADIYEIDRGFLIGTAHAMYVSDDQLYLTRVAGTQIHDVYTAVGAQQVLGETERGEIVVYETLHKLLNMTAFEFVAKVVLNMDDIDVEFDLTRDELEGG